MDVTQQGILLLLKSAITEKPQALPDGFDIEAAWPLIRSHHMIPLCYDGAVRCGVPRQHPVMQQMFKSYCKAMLVSEGQIRALTRLCAAFDENGIGYMPLKGSEMKYLYPKPELRIMGDADILIRVEQYDRIVPLMTLLGFSPVLESDHELIWKSPALYVELHKRLIPSYNEDYYAYFGDGWDQANPVSGGRHAMTAEDNWIYLFTHFAKHYRDGGIGCRHVADLWVYRRAHPAMDEKYIEKAMKKLRLLEFHENVCRLVNAWFGDGELDERTEVLSACIFASGSWGKQEDHLLSQTIKKSRHSILSFSGRLVYLRDLLLPGINSMRQLYPILEKKPWLLPVMWVYRSVYKVLFESGKIGYHRQRMETLSREKLNQRQQMLRYVGLDYHF